MIQSLIREAKTEDMNRVFELVKELSEFEMLTHEVENTVEGLIEDGFGQKPLFGCLVAEYDGIIVGISVYYFRYSTWKRKRLYLEDIIVTEKHRNKGIGKQLFEATIEQAKKLNCSGLQLQVLDWNKNAIAFYESYGLTIDKSWMNAGISF